MTIVLHIFKLIALAALGYASIFLVIYLALETGMISSLPADEYLYSFRLTYFGGGMMAVITGISLGAISLFTQGRLATLLLFLPFLVPALFSISVLAYFSLLP